MEILLFIFIAFWLGHAKSNHHHAKRAGKRGIGLIWYTGMGPLISLPIPGMKRTRITHRF